MSSHKIALHAERAVGILTFLRPPFMFASPILSYVRWTRREAGRGYACEQPDGLIDGIIPIRHVYGHLKVRRVNHVVADAPGAPGAKVRVGRGGGLDAIRAVRDGERRGAEKNEALGLARHEVDRVGARDSDGERRFVADAAGGGRAAVVGEGATPGSGG